MLAELKALGRARAVNGGFPFAAPIRQWKAAGGKVIGFGCTYVPEEIIYAAGMLPVRVVGDNRDSGFDQADVWLHNSTCSYERSRFQMALDGQYSFLDGFVSTVMCDLHRRSLEVWRYLELSPFVYLLELPMKDDENSIPRFLSYLKGLIVALEKHFDVRITEDDLRRGIAVVNRKRHLLEQVNALRAAEAPAISGAEVLEVMNAGFMMPADQFGELLAALLDELRAGNRQWNVAHRLMLAGSPINNAEFIAGIERLGALVVTDEICMGRNYWDRQVEEREGANPLEAIAHRYHYKIPCPRRSPFERRLSSALALAKEYRAHGVILQVIHSCFPHAYHAPTLKRHMEHYGFPVLELDKEYGTGWTGQLSTRIQAFLESLEA